MYSIKHLDLRYSDTDQMGVIYHANYLSFFEQARTKFYLDLGFKYHETEADGIIFPVREVKVKYMRAIRFGETVHIKTTLHEITKIKVTYYHEIYNDKKELKSTAYTTVVSVDKNTFKTVKITERLPKVFQVYNEVLKEDE